MRIVVAPDTFKGSLAATEVAAALAAGIRETADVAVLECPMADGGEGSVDCASAAGWRAARVRVAGPVGELVDATYAVSPDGTTAMVELAEASGITLLPRRPDPELARTATSRGTGELMKDALGMGVRRVVLAAGGSACTDGGAGMLEALGLRLRDASGATLAPGGAALAGLAEVDASGLDARLHDVELVLAADVDNPLLGDDGAAAVYGPQKGADPRTVQLLDDALGRWADHLQQQLPSADPSAPGAGAAGGVGFAALALGAHKVSGATLIGDLVGLPEAVASADLVVTGEGCLDRSSLSGKVPVTVLETARQHRVPVVAVCGTSRLSPAQATEAGFSHVHELRTHEPDLERSIKGAADLLHRVGEQIGRDLLN